MLIGRHEERARIEEALAERRPLVVVGEAGIGKTSLVQAAFRGHAAGHAACAGLATLSWMPYLPLMGILEGAEPRGDAAAVAEQVTRALDGRVLVIEDAHWADVDTLEVLPLLVGRTALLVTVRQGDRGAEAALAALDPAEVTRLQLAGLAREDADALLCERRPELSEGQRAEVVAAARGNPFLLEELGPAGRASDTAGLLFTANLERLSGDGRESVIRLALLGRPAPLDLVGPALLEAVEAGLVVESSQGLFTPRHALIGDAAISRVEADRRGKIHAALAEDLEPGEAARHLAAAGRREAAHELALEAAESAGNLTERARHLALAANCAEPGAGSDRLRLEAADAALATAHPAETLELTAQVTGSAEDRARASAMTALAHFQLGERRAAEEAAELALGLAGDRAPGVAAEALRLKALFHVWDWNGEQARPLAERALELSLANGHAVIPARLTLARALYVSEDRDALGRAEEARRAARASGDVDLELDSAFLLVVATQAFGDPDAAYAECEVAIARARETGLRKWELQFGFFRANLDHCVRGAYDEAIDGFRGLLREAAALGENLHRARAGFVVALAETGRDEEAREALERSVGAAESTDARGSLAWALGDLHWLAGRPGEALVAAMEGASIESPYANVSRLTWAWAARDLGRPGRPPEPPGELPTRGGNMLELQALAVFDDSPKEAERLFLEAADAWRTTFLSARARCLWAAGDAALADGDVQRAREHLLAAEELAERLGLPPYGARIRRSLRATGVRREGRPSPNGAGLLTPRESEVIELVGEGLTSREVATRLGIAGSTVDSQVKSAMRKLDVRSRRQAALAARELSDRDR